MSWSERIHRCFVEYNPLYFASATCVFAGVWLVAEGLPVDHFGSKLAVAGVTEAYQLLVIAGAWLLLRQGQRRPAAILGLVALLFALDVAFSGERLFSHARTLSLAPGMRARAAVPASLAFAALGPLKILLLARVFRLPGSGACVGAAGGVVFALPLLPYAIEAAGSDEARRLAHLFFCWLGAPLLAWALARPAWRLDGGEDLRARRIAFAVPALTLGLFLVHAASWSAFPALRLGPAHAAPYVLVAFAAWAGRLDGRRAELAALAGALAALGMSTSGALPLGIQALLCGGTLLGLVLRRDVRVLLPAIVCVFGGAFVLSSGRLPPPVPAPGWTMTLCAALTAAAAGHRELRCLIGASAALAAAVVGPEPSRFVVPHALMAGGLWAAATSWLLFPERRRTLPCAALAAVLLASLEPLFREPASNAFGVLGVSSLALTIGLARRWAGYTLAGAGGLGALAAATRAFYAPSGPLSWGLLLLGAGFVFLAGGLGLNLRANHGGPRLEARPADSGK